MEFRYLTASLADPGILLEAWQSDTLAVGLFSDPEHPTKDLVGGRATARCSSGAASRASPVKP